MEFLNIGREWFKEYPVVADGLIATGILILGYISFKLTVKLGFALIKRLARKSKTQFDDIIVENRALQPFAFLVPLIIVYNLAAIVPQYEAIVETICHLLMVVAVIRGLIKLLHSLNQYYETLPRSKERPIKGYIQIATIVFYIISSIYIIGLLTGQSPLVVLGGIGALTAVILLVFKDTILSFIAGIQITSYDLIHVGDWISMPQYGADGDVVDIALHTVKVQNWDKTFTVIPTYKFTQDAYKNWQGMAQAGGRRIKRSVYIDQNSISFLDKQMVEHFKKIHLLKDYIEKKQNELEKFNRENNIDDNVLVNGRRMTNLGTFRAYTSAYIKNHPKVKPNLTNMVRQLPPGPQGLPIEIYLFTNDIAWENYEAIQSDIFDHLLAIIPEFGLRIFQNPSGKDFSKISGK